MLDESCETYLHELVLVKPVYGWGWTRLDAPDISVPAEINGVPFPFKCRITEFLYHHNRPNGALGRIEESNHIYDNLWMFFYLRVQGIFNFTDEIGYYNLEIGSPPPEIVEKDESLEFKSGEPIVNGYAHIAESLRHIERYDARQIEKWEIMRDAENVEN